MATVCEFVTGDNEGCAACLSACWCIQTMHNGTIHHYSITQAKFVGRPPLPTKRLVPPHFAPCCNFYLWVGVWPAHV